MIILNICCFIVKPKKVLLTTSAMNKTACLGDVINFTCSADANPTVTSYQLFKNDSSIFDTSMSGMWNETLEIAGVFFYRCVANNTLGSTHSTNVMLTVNGNFFEFSHLNTFSLL